jgi:flagellar basal body P-ring formation protein FlgA
MRRLKLGFIWLVLLGLLPGVEPAQGALAFKGEAKIAGDYITLTDLADLPPEVAQRCGAAPVWSAPPPGEVYTLTQEFLKYRLEQMGILDLLEGAALPAAIQVRQTGVPLNGDTVAATFRTYIQQHTPYPPSNLNIEVVPLKEVVILPDAQISLAPVPPHNGKLMGDVTLEMVIMHQGQPLKRLKVSGVVRLKRLVVCATRPLQPQAIIAPGDVQVVSREVAGKADDFYIATEQVVGHILAKSVGPQEILTTRHLSSQPIIKRGDSVNVVLDQDGMEISTKGVAQEQGFAGKTIRLINPKSKKEIQGLVLDAKTVKVQL